MLQAPYFTNEETEAFKGKISSLKLHRSLDFQGQIYTYPTGSLSNHISLTREVLLGIPTQLHIHFFKFFQPHQGHVKHLTLKFSFSVSGLPNLANALTAN
jgi:hypothetical protein